MDYIEINNHTATRVLHNEASLRARLKALRYSKASDNVLKFPIDTDHARFRPISIDDRGVQFLPNGGTPVEYPKCSCCNASGHENLEVSEQKTVEIPCRLCNGQRYVVNARRE